MCLSMVAEATLYQPLGAAAILCELRGLKAWKEMDAKKSPIYLLKLLLPTGPAMILA